MNENTKVMVRVEYESDGMRKVYYGQIDETKLENVNTGGENFICMENGGLITWLDKESLISIETLRIKKAIFLKPRITDYSRTKNKVSKNAGMFAF